MYYLILVGAIAIFLGGIFLVHRLLPNKEKLIVERIFVYVLIAIFAVRYMCYHDVQFDSANYNEFASFGGPMNGFLNTIGNLCIWFEITAALMVLLRPWAGFKTAKFYVKCIATPVLLVCAVALYPMLNMMQGHDNWSVLTVMLPIEVGGLLSLCIFYWAKDYKVKISKHSYTEVATFSVFINLATMPPFIPLSFFGFGLPSWTVIDYTLVHRVYLYLFCLIIPLVIYFSFRNAHQDKIRYTLIFFSVGTLLSFMVGTKYDSILAPWRWPLHLCNLAMILLPLCLIFKLK